MPARREDSRTRDNRKAIPVAAKVLAAFVALLPAAAGDDGKAARAREGTLASIRASLAEFEGALKDAVRTDVRESIMREGQDRLSEDCSRKWNSAKADLKALEKQLKDAHGSASKAWRTLRFSRAAPVPADLKALEARVELAGKIVAKIKAADALQTESKVRSFYRELVQPYAKAMEADRESTAKKDGPDGSSKDPPGAGEDKPDPAASLVPRTIDIECPSPSTITVYEG